MRRLLAVLAVALLGTGTADAKEITLRWHGQSFFALESSQGTRIVFDPHGLEAYGRKLVRADLVLISHLHTDHTNIEAIENRQKAKFIAGIKGDARRQDWVAIDEKFRDVHVRTVGVYHDNVMGMERGKNAILIVEIDGLRLVHLGDLGHLLTEEQIKEIGPVDVLLIPVGGVYTINGSEAKKVVAQLKPKRYIVPMHYGTKVYDELLTENEFLDEQKKENIKVFATTNKLSIDTDAKPPAEPTIVLLNWK